MMLHESIIVAQLRNDDEIRIIGDETELSLPNELVRVLKYICKNFANYILIDNPFVEFIRGELRIAKIQEGMDSFTEDVETIALYFSEDPELTVFSVLDGEDFYGYE